MGGARKRLKIYCALCAWRRAGLGQIILRGEWLPICRECYHAKLSGAATTLQELERPGSYAVRVNDSGKSARVVRDELTRPLFE
jgi:hypothetical protein